MPIDRARVLINTRTVVQTILEGIDRALAAKSGARSFWQQPMWATKFHKTLAFGTAWSLSLLLGTLGALQGDPSNVMFLVSFGAVVGALFTLVMSLVLRRAWNCTLERGVAQYAAVLSAAAANHAPLTAPDMAIIASANSVLTMSAQVSIDNQRDLETCMRCLTCAPCVVPGSCNGNGNDDCATWVISPLSSPALPRLQTQGRQHWCFALGLRGCLRYAWFATLYILTINMAVSLGTRLDQRHKYVARASDGHLLVSFIHWAHAVALWHLLLIWHPQVRESPLTQDVVVALDQAAAQAQHPPALSLVSVSSSMTASSLVVPAQYADQDIESQMEPSVTDGHSASDVVSSNRNSSNSSVDRQLVRADAQLDLSKTRTDVAHGHDNGNGQTACDLHVPAEQLVPSAPIVM